jgi:hypothetical protein
MLVSEEVQRYRVFALWMETNAHVMHCGDHNNRKFRTMTTIPNKWGEYNSKQIFDHFHCMVNFKVRQEEDCGRGLEAIVIIIQEYIG